MANTTKKLTPDGDDMPDVQTLAQAAGGDVVTCPDRLNIYVQGESYTVFAGSTLAVRYKGGAV